MSFSNQSTKSRGTEDLYHDLTADSRGKSLSWQSANERASDESQFGNQMARSGVSRTSQDPWADQAPYLQDMFQEAKALYEGSWQDAADQAQQAFQTGAEQMQERMGEVEGARQQFATGWDTLRERQEKATGRFDTLVDDILGYGMQDVQGEAAQFASQNPYLEQAIAQSYENAGDLLAEQLGGPGGLEHEAALGRNMSSSRAGVAQGVAAAEMADKAQANELAMRQSAYEQGLGQANRLQQGRQAMANLVQTDPNVMNSIMAASQAGDYNAQAMMADLASQAMLAGASGAETAYTPFQAYYPVVGGQVYGHEGEVFEDASAEESGYQRDTRESQRWGKSKTQSKDKTKTKGTTHGTTTSRSDSGGFGFNLANFLGF